MAAHGSSLFRRPPVAPLPWQHMATSRPHKHPAGVGLGLRVRHLDDFVAGQADGRVDFIEISPENFMHRGGKSPAALAQIAEHHPVITHGLMMSLGGAGPFDPDYMDELRAFIARHRPPWHSDHLCFSALDGAVLHDLLPVPFSTATARRTAARVAEARDRLDIPMAVENISWYAQMGEGGLDEADFITEVLDRADCGLLLDVNNCFVNARNHGFDVQDWIEKIPLERVWQIHIAGHERYDDDLWVDTHGAPVHDRVHELLAWVIERVGPVPVLLERDNNIPPLPELLREVDQVRATYERGLARHRARSKAPSLATGAARPPEAP